MLYRLKILSGSRQLGARVSAQIISSTSGYLQPLEITRPQGCLGARPGYLERLRTTRALVHSQQVALTRAQDAAAELELSWGPSTTQLEAAEHQARWDPAMQRGRRCRRRGRSRRPHHRPRCAACHWSAWSAASAASGLVLAASGYTWVAPESGPWAEPFQRV